MRARFASGLVIVSLGWAALAPPAGAGGPIRLDDAQLDRITAGLIVAEADALAFAAGDRFAETHTDARTRTVASQFFEVGVAIALARAIACCDGPVAHADSWAETSGELTVTHTVTVTHSSSRLSRALSFSIAFGLNRLFP